ncbi:MAG: murB [Solimicrobium sp.]|jgi:UDP-N-acetylmuramate dehydrogenase|nr:murB [Solimicrobium sp.]
MLFSKPPFQSDVQLQSFTTFGIVASARFYLRIIDVTQLRQVSQLPELTKLPLLVLGGGSNVILTGDFSGVVLHIALVGREYVTEDDHFIYVRAAAGESWHDFVQWTLQQGWGGLENLSLIPGSVGAAPIQNIGAYGVEMKDCFHSLTWFELANGKIHTLTYTDCQFGYRDSVFKHALSGQGVILDVTFALAKQWQAKLRYDDVARILEETTVGAPTPQQISSAICKIRQSKLPDTRVIGNVGSFFKNPLVSAECCAALLVRFPQLINYPQANGQYKLAAGWLIEKAGWKGHVAGRVGVYSKQALVLVNLGGALGSDVIALARRIQADVERQFGVQLEIEPFLA